MLMVFLNIIAVHMDESTMFALYVGGGIILLAWLLSQYLTYRIRVKDGKSIAAVWDAFQVAFESEDADGMNKWGRELIYNTHVSQNQLNEARKMVNHRVDEFPQLGELGLLVFSRCLGQ
jgi:hypothetical protein